MVSHHERGRQDYPYPEKPESAIVQEASSTERHYGTTSMTQIVIKLEMFDKKELKIAPLVEHTLQIIKKYSRFSVSGISVGK